MCKAHEKLVAAGALIALGAIGVVLAYRGDGALAVAIAAKVVLVAYAASKQ